MIEGLPGSLPPKAAESNTPSSKSQLPGEQASFQTPIFSSSDSKFPIFRTALVFFFGMITAALILGATGAMAFNLKQAIGEAVGGITGITEVTLNQVINPITKQIPLSLLPTGSGSGLDADLLDGLHAASFALKADFDAAAGNLTKRINEVTETVGTLDFSPYLKKIEQAADSLKLAGKEASHYLNATNISSGTLLDTRLSTNVSLLDLVQTFTASKTFSAGLAVSGGALTLPTGSITSSFIADGTVSNADISSTAAIAYSKLALAGSIVGGDLNGNIAISTSGNISAGVLSGTSYLALGTTPAQSAGIIRIPNNTFISGRNSANNNDIRVIELDSSDTISFRGGGVTFDSSNNVAILGNYLRIGTTPATVTQGLGVPNNSQILAYRNAANTANIVGLTSDGSNKLYIGDGTNDGGLILRSSTDIIADPGSGTGVVRIQRGGSDRFVFQSNGAISLFANLNPATTGGIRTIASGLSAGFVSRNAGNTADLNIVNMSSRDVVVVGKVPAVRAEANANQTVVTGTTIAVALATESTDTDSMHDNVTNNSRVTFQTAGKYLLLGAVSFTNGTELQFNIRKNGTTGLANQYTSGSASAEWRPAPASYVGDFIAGDYVELTAFNNSGANRDVQGVTIYTYLQAVRIGD